MKAPTAHLKGYVTTHSAVAGKSASEAEDALGFNAGALARGFLLYELAAPVHAGEFEWKDRTLYADGWHYDATIDEYVQRFDELRAHLGKRFDYDERVTDRALDQFLAEHVRRLNVRSGPGRIVKLVPKSRPASYPDSSTRETLQWKLTVTKQFHLAADVGPGERVP